MTKGTTNAGPPAPQAQTSPAPQAQTSPTARLAKGFRDIEAAELIAQRDMIEKIRAVYERYGFEALETPAIEYTDALGKFLPDQDRPNAGVFSFQDESDKAGGGQWMSLRYDLTAPLARYVAQNFQTLPKPFRRYAYGNVYRNEKPGPGRFRQFMQFDADTVGSDSVAADAEMCMLAADTLEALDLDRSQYRIKANNRKILDGVLASVGIDPTSSNQKSLRMTVLRALDKYDRVMITGVEQLLGKGRRDESGDFTPGAELKPDQIKKILSYLTAFNLEASRTLETLHLTVGKSEIGKQGITELATFSEIVAGAGYGLDRIQIDPTVVRGLEYYTGPVFEAELTFEVKGDDAKPVRFGSVGGGGRYDDLVARFTGQKVPATGFSIGVSRLQAALSLIDQSKKRTLGPVVVLVLDKDRIADYQKLTQKLRTADPPIRAEMYLGSSGMKAQMKYADKRNSPCVIIQGSDERGQSPPTVTIKDLVFGAKIAGAFESNREWKEANPAQFSVPESDMVAKVRELIARHQV